MPSDEKAIEAMGFGICRDGGLVDPHDGPCQTLCEACRLDATAALAAYRRVQQEAGIVEVGYCDCERTLGKLRRVCDCKDGWFAAAQEKDG